MGGRYSASDDQLEHPLIRSLKGLRRLVFSWRQPWERIDPCLYLSPFLDVIRSDETGAQITGVALSAVCKMVHLEIFDADTANVDIAMHTIVDSVTSCRFEVTDPASEEVLSMKILQVCRRIICFCDLNKGILKPPHWVDCRPRGSGGDSESLVQHFDVVS